MSARRLRSVAVAAVQPPRFPERPEWAHPMNDPHRARYVAAVAFLRAGKGWLLDRPATRLTTKEPT
jgi:hypothetical protein